MDVDAITRERAEEFARFTREKAMEASQRLSNWVILANGAGLGLTINAVISGALAQEYPFKIAYGLFLLAWAQLLSRSLWAPVTSTSSSPSFTR